MAKIKTPEERETLREAGRRLATIMQDLRALARPGVTTEELDRFVEERIRAGGDTPAFKDYKPAGAARAFPATLCVSINDEAVHGIPSGERRLAAGDVVSLDAGLTHDGLIADMCITVPVGDVDAGAHALMRAAEDALMAGITAAKGGARLGDIGAAIEDAIRGTGFSIVKDLGGHGVGHAVHERPHIFHFGERGTGSVLEPGMVITIEPTIAEGRGEIRLAPDEFTYLTSDGSRTAQFEHTIIITDGEPEIITML
jgi:methionyl aminopeptidase